MSQRTQSRSLGDADYEQLLGFRDGLRRFLHWSEEQAKQQGLTAAQHQLLLAVRGHDGAPCVGEIADHLLLRHHSAVELVDRAEQVGLIRRSVDPDDHRVVRVELTRAGRRHLEELAAVHLEQLSRMRPSFEALWSDLPD